MVTAPAGVVGALDHPAPSAGGVAQQRGTQHLANSGSGRYRSHVAALHPSLWLALAIAVLGCVLAGRLAACAAVPRHWAAYTGAIALLALTWLSPLESLGAAGVLSAHLVQLVLLMGAVPALLVMALPPGALGSGQRMARAGRLATHPAIALVAVNAAFFALHAAPVYDAMLRSRALYDLGSALLLATALLFWWPVIAPGGAARLTLVGRLFYILVATIPQTFAGLTLALSRHLVYQPPSIPPAILGMTQSDDQIVAGALMAVLTKVALLTAFAVLLVRLLSGAADDDDGGSADRPEGDRPPEPGHPAWLDALEEGRTAPEPTPRPRLPRRERVPVAAGAPRR